MPRNLLLTALLLLACFTLTACKGRPIEIGRVIDQSRVQDIHQGMDMGQVKAMFGKPYSTGTGTGEGDDGQLVQVETWIYLHSIGYPNGDSKAESLAIVFGPDNKVLHHKFSDGSEQEKAGSK